MAATTVKKPSENSPIKRVRRRRCERKQTPKTRVSAMRGKSWEKTVEDTILTVKQEIKLIGDAMDHDDEDVLGRYGGFGGALKRLAALQSLPEAKVTEGVSIDDCSTWFAERFAGPGEDL